MCRKIKLIVLLTLCSSSSWTMEDNCKANRQRTKHEQKIHNKNLKECERFANKPKKLLLEDYELFKDAVHRLPGNHLEGKRFRKRFDKIFIKHNWLDVFPDFADKKEKIMGQTNLEDELLSRYENAINEVISGLISPDEFLGLFSPLEQEDQRRLAAYLARPAKQRKASKSAGEISLSENHIAVSVPKGLSNSEKSPFIEASSAEQVEQEDCGITVLSEDEVGEIVILEENYKDSNGQFCSAVKALVGHPEREAAFKNKYPTPQVNESFFDEPRTNELALNLGLDLSEAFGEKAAFIKSQYALAISFIAQGIFTAEDFCDLFLSPSSPKPATRSETTAASIEIAQNTFYQDVTTLSRHSDYLPIFTETYSQLYANEDYLKTPINCGLSQYLGVDLTSSVANLKLQLEKQRRAAINALVLGHCCPQDFLTMFQPNAPQGERTILAKGSKKQRRSTDRRVRKEDVIQQIASFEDFRIDSLKEKEKDFKSKVDNQEIACLAELGDKAHPTNALKRFMVGNEILLRLLKADHDMYSIIKKIDENIDYDLDLSILYEMALVALDHKDLSAHEFVRLFSPLTDEEQRIVEKANI